MQTTTKLIAMSGVGLLSLTLGLPAHAQSVNLTFLIDNAPTTMAQSEALVTAFEAANPDINVEIEARPGGSEGDNIVKSRLATGVMADLFLYNAGALFQAISPQQTTLDLTSEPWMSSVQQSFQSVVKAPDGTVRGVPFGAAMVAGIFYNKPIYAELGLEIPKTWDEFMANNEKIKAAGKTAVIQTYGETWTSQILVLGDFYNVQASNPNFAADYTAGKAKFATDPAAIRGFEKLQDIYDGGFLNADFGAATYNDGARQVALGEGAHYPMLSNAIGSIADNYPDNLDDVGFFAEPGDDASKNGLTVWMPTGMYIAATTANEEAAKKFVEFVTGPEACTALTTAEGGASGPYLINSCSLPENVSSVVKDLLPYFEEGGQNGPALEFLSPIKGPALEQITVEVGSGIRPAADAAALYDEDVRKQAQQLGLAGW